MIRTTLLGALLLAVAVTACKGGDDPEPTPLPGGLTPAPTAAKDAGDIEKLSALYLAGVDGEYTYELSGSGVSIIEGTLTKFRLGNADRSDWATDSFGFAATTTTIMNGEAFYVCTHAQGFDQCDGSTLDEIANLRFMEVPILTVLPAIVADASKFEISDLANETFAGVEARCFQADTSQAIGGDQPSEEKIKICFGAEGALLYMRREILPGLSSVQPGVVTLEAQEISTAQASDFEPAIAPQ